MPQYNLPEHYPSVFVSEPPRLAYVWYDLPPRILHQHEGIVELHLFVSGSARFTVDEQSYTVREGDLVAVNGGVPHDQDAAHGEKLVCYGIALTGLHLYGLPPDTILPQDAVPVISLGEKYDTVRMMFETIYKTVGESRTNFAEAGQLLAAGLVSLFVRQFSRRTMKQMDSNDRMLTTRIRNYIEQHYAEELSLPGIGKALHISSYYMAHVFKASTGYSPMQYAIRLRIGRAQELLSTTDYPIIQIAGMVGYDNPSHFNAMFTKNIGMSPGKYRKTFQQTASEPEKKTKP